VGYFSISTIQQIKEKLLNDSLPDDLKLAIKNLGKNPKRPLGKFNPWAWWVEPVYGCNLKCHFCATRLFPEGRLIFMDEKIWVNLLTIMNEITPYTRLELGNAGEPTLHPQFLKFL